ncbi:MAG: class I SAM-dependent methyltransferase, partial [Bosea sp. (in: a-proteobacteria)]
NSDIGSFSAEHSRANAAMMERTLPPLIMPGGFVMSDCLLHMPGFEALPLPEGAPAGGYYLYRRV